MAQYNKAQIQDMIGELVEIRIGAKSLEEYLKLADPSPDLLIEITENMKDCCKRLKDNIEKK